MSEKTNEELRERVRENTLQLDDEERFVWQQRANNKPVVTKKISTVDDLLLSPVWREAPKPGQIVNGTARQEAVITAWLAQAGDTCTDCGKPLTRGAGPNRMPTLVYFGPGRPRWEPKHLRVICGKCADEQLVDD